MGIHDCDCSWRGGIHLFFPDGKNPAGRSLASQGLNQGVGAYPQVGDKEFSVLRSIFLHLYLFISGGVSTSAVACGRGDRMALGLCVI